MINKLINWLLRFRVSLLIKHATWTREDENALSAYLSTLSGKRLILVLQKLSIQRNTTAVMNGTPHVCGQAVGYSLVLQDIQTLSGAAPQSSNTEDQAEQGDAGNLDYLHP